MLEARTYEDLYRYASVEGPGVASELVGTMGAVGLLLTIAGLYWSVAYNVSRRTREIGIRIAIGARPRDVLRLAMGRGLVLVGIGTGIGLAMGSAVEHLFNSMIFNAGGVDLVVYVAVVPSLLLVTMLAAYMPARRASRIAPTQALRYEQGPPKRRLRAGLPSPDAKSLLLLHGVLVQYGNQLGCLFGLLGAAAENLFAGPALAVEGLVLVEVVAQRCAIEGDSREQTFGTRPGENLGAHVGVGLRGGVAAHGPAAAVAWPP